MVLCRQFRQILDCTGIVQAIQADPRLLVTLCNVNCETVHPGEALLMCCSQEGKNWGQMGLRFQLQ